MSPGGVAADLELSVYLVTDSDMAASQGRTVPEVVAAAVAGGVTCVQVRAKHAAGREFLDLVGQVCETAAGVPVLVNDRVDVLLAARLAGLPVAGVHVGQRDLPVRVVRQLVGPDAVVGVSANTVQLAARAAEQGADYVGVGPVRRTTTKQTGRQPLGVNGFAGIVAGAGVPAVAIGGVAALDAAALRAAGAAGVAVVSAICAAPQPEQAARELSEAWATAAPTAGEDN